MKLLTKELIAKFPSLYATENEKDPLILCRFFTMWNTWEWYPIEFDGNDTFFGWVRGFEDELGYFSLAELEAVNGPLGLTVERDLFFTPLRQSELRAKMEKIIR